MRRRQYARGMDSTLACPGDFPNGVVSDRAFHLRLVQGWNEVAVYKGNRSEVYVTRLPEGRASWSLHPFTERAGVLFSN